MNLLTKTALMISLFTLCAMPVYSEVVTTTTTTTQPNVRSEAPIYNGPVVEAQLEELTIGDFQTIVTNPNQAFDEFREYKKSLNDPNVRHLYKMKVTRDLVLTDFQGDGVSPELARTRYNTYLAAKDAKPGSSSYVYVYHAPVVRAVVAA